MPSILLLARLQRQCALLRRTRPGVWSDVWSENLWRQPLAPLPIKRRLAAASTGPLIIERLVMGAQAVCVLCLMLGNSVQLCGMPMLIGLFYHINRSLVPYLY